MMRHITLTLSCLMAGSFLSQGEVLVNINGHDPQILELDGSHVLDLGDHFWLYSDPGPVATFSLHMPVQTGFKDLLYKTTGNYTPDYNPEGPTREMMTYQMADGSEYTHWSDPLATPTNFVWENYSVNFQLRGDLAPIAVGNFIQYLLEDSYDNVIVHRSEIGVIQMGGYRLSDTEGFLLQEIPSKGTIPFEETIDNAQGTLAMARGSSFNSASSEFYINLVDNTEGLGKNYSVFGEVMDFSTNMPILEQMGDAWIENNLGAFMGTVFGTTPLYSPFWLEQESYVSIQDISIPEGNRTGVTYSFEFGDLDGVEGTSDEEAAHNAVWDIAINGSQLEISRHDSGLGLLIVKGTFGDQERSFTIPLTGYKPEAMVAFPQSNIEQEGYLNNAWYSHFKAETFPQIFHDNHGEQWVYYTEDEDTGDYSFYIYDINMISWVYTSPVLYPFMYVFETGHWLGYVNTTGNGVDEPRWFWDFDLAEWINFL